MANSQQSSASQHPDLLAAVVLHTLVHEGLEGLSAAEIAVACERDPSQAEELQETVVALEILLADGLARQEGDLFFPTRPALRAQELSF